MTEELNPTDAPPAPITETSARRDTASHLRLWMVAVVGLAVDLWTKHWAFSNLPPDSGRVIIPRLMSFHRSLNPGALFGLGKGYTVIFIVASILALAFVLFLFVNSSHRRWSLHIALGLVMAGALGNLYDRVFSLADVVHYTRKGPKGEVDKFVATGLIVDDNAMMLRLASWPEAKDPRPILKEWDPKVSHIGVVRDFIRMEPRIKIGSHQFDIWPWVFNIADALLVFGVAILMLNFWFERKQTVPAPNPATPLPDAPA